VTTEGASSPADGGVPSAVAGDSDLQTFTLESLASARNYHRWLCDLVQPYLGEDPLEIGSGLGDYAETWLENGQSTITVSDADRSRRAMLTKRFAADPRVTVRDLDVFAPYDGAHSSLVALNVLEHIEDHVGALASAHRLVRPGGHVVMFVPAFPFAMSRFDRQVGHFRRYRLATLRRTYLDAGLRVERIHYVNAPGLLAWFVGMRLLGMTPQDGLTVRLWDRIVTPVTRAVESRIRPPFGQSLLAVGTVGR
jgi:SAM-dependent methyltransferase